MKTFMMQEEDGEVAGGVVGRPANASSAEGACAGDESEDSVLTKYKPVHTQGTGMSVDAGDLGTEGGTAHLYQNSLRESRKRVEVKPQSQGVDTLRALTR